VRKLFWLLCLTTLPTASTLANGLANGVALDRVGGSLVLTSDYRLHGVSQTDGRPALQADLHYDTPRGWFAGGWATNYTLYGEENQTVQLNAFLGRRWKVGNDWSAKLMLAHYAHPWDSRAQHYDYDEITAAAAWRDQLFFSASWAPNNSVVWAHGFSLNRTSLAYDATARMPLRGAVSWVAGIGYYDLSDLVGKSYWYGSAGLTYDLPAVHLEVRCNLCADCGHSPSCSRPLIHRPPPPRRAPTSASDNCSQAWSRKTAKRSKSFMSCITARSRAS
jgi:uncharacterized protein (TIGR02001 family)